MNLWTSLLYNGRQSLRSLRSQLHPPTQQSQTTEPSILGFGRTSCSTLLHIALIVLLIFVAYSGSFDGEFVSDDIRRVRENPIIRSLQWSHIKEIFTTFDGANYMPLKVLSLAVDYQLWGPTPTGFHITNLLIHISCAFVIYIILMRMGMRQASGSRLSSANCFSPL